MQCLRREWAVPSLQRGRLRLQGGGGGDGQPGKEGRQEHGHQVHRGAPHQVDLLQPMLLHAILHQMPGHRNPASRYTHHLVILQHTFSLLAVASCNSAALVRVAVQKAHLTTQAPRAHLARALAAVAILWMRTRKTRMRLATMRMRDQPSAAEHRPILVRRKDLMAHSTTTATRP